MTMSARADETSDTLLRGKLSLFQPRRGYRTSLDAVLLARFVTDPGSGEVLELGSGNGPVALMLARLHPQARVVGLELQGRMIERARRSTDLNRLGDRVEFLQGDVRRISEILQPESFDVVVSNPPYRAPRSGRINPDEEKRIARHEVEGTLADFLRAGGYALRKRGKVAAVFPSTRAIDLVAGMREQGLEPKRVRFVHARVDGPASLILVEGAKEGGRELKVLAPLVVYGEDGSYTGEVRELLGD
jgi:tRNA1Val (adenine37-N6)-methyltransferase